MPTPPMFDAHWFGAGEKITPPPRNWRAAYTNQPIWSDQELPEDKRAKAISHLVKSAAPSILSYSGDKLREAATGVADTPIKETKPGGGMSVRVKLHPDERLERVMGEATRMKIKHVDVGQARIGKYLGAKEELKGTKSVLRAKIAGATARKGSPLTREEKDAIMAPYKERLKEDFGNLPK